MSRKSVWPPKSHFHKPTGQDRVRWQGQDYYLGKSGSSQARANYVSLISKLDAERKARPAPVPLGEPCVADVVVAWRNHAAKEYGDTQEVGLIDSVLARLLDLFARIPATHFGLDHLEQFRDHLIGVGLCRGVINKHVIRVRTVWRFAERKGLAGKGSWNHLRTLPPLRPGRGVRETPKVRPAEWADVEAAARAATPSVRGLLLAQWYTGARPTELTIMRVGQLVVADGLGVYEPTKHKNAWRGQSRTIVFGPQALAAIQGLIASRKATDLVFPNAKGNEYTRTSYHQSVARACKRAGVLPIAPYRIRHSAKRRFTREMSLDAARAILGQATLSTTDRYAAGGDEKLATDTARKCG